LNCPNEHPSFPCPECHGDGKFHPRGEDTSDLFKVAHEMVGGDADGLQAMLEDMS